MGVVAHFLPTLCRQGQRSGRVCGCTTVLLGANILTHSSVSLVGAVPQQAPVLELFTELFLIRNYPRQVYTTVKQEQYDIPGP